MIYIVFWYLVTTTFVSVLSGFYRTVVAKDTNANKVGKLFGITLQMTTALYFLYVVYPLLELIK
jgi:hypothetical protein